MQSTNFIDYCRMLSIIDFIDCPGRNKNQDDTMNNPGGVLLEDLGGGVQCASGNPYPISDQNM